MQGHSRTLLSHLETSVFPIGAFHLQTFYRMWDVHGHSDCSGWLKLYLPLVWSASFPYQRSSEVLYRTRSNSGVLWLLFVRDGYFKFQSAPVIIMKGYCGCLDRLECFSTVKRLSMSSNSATINLLRKSWNEHAVSTSEAARRQIRRLASTWRGTDCRRASWTVIPGSHIPEYLCCGFTVLKLLNTEVGVVPRRWW